MPFQGVLLAIFCLLAITAEDVAGQDNIANVLSPPLAPQPIVAPPVTPSAPESVPCPYDPQITAADCPNKSCYGAPPNGCGSRSVAIIREEIVPDEWPAGVNFHEACNVHDTCYFTPGTQKNDCDNNFHLALVAECNRALGCTNLPIVGRQCFQNPSENPLFAPCKGLADLYFSAVQRVGQDAFNRDQIEAKAYADQCKQAASQRTQLVG